MGTDREPSIYSNSNFSFNQSCFCPRIMKKETPSWGTLRIMKKDQPATFNTLRIMKKDQGPSSVGVLRIMKKEHPSLGALRIMKRKTPSWGTLRIMKKDTPTLGTLRIMKRSDITPAEGEDMLKLMPYLYNGNLHHLLNSVEVEA